MLTLNIKANNNAFESSKQAIARGEPFAVVIEGFSAKLVKRMRPFFAYLSGINEQKPGKLEGLKCSVYALFIGDFGAIYHSAIRARMNAIWKEGSNSVTVFFKFAE